MPRIEPIVRHYGPLPLGDMEKVKMLDTLPGSNDGLTVRLYLAGEIYDVSAELAKSFVGSGAAERVAVLEEEEDDGFEEVKKEQAPAVGPSEAHVVAPAETNVNRRGRRGRRK